MKRHINCTSKIFSVMIQPQLCFFGGKNGFSVAISDIVVVELFNGDFFYNKSTEKLKSISVNGDHSVQALQINKTDLTLWFSTARSGLKEGNIELSLCAYKEVLKLNPRHLLALTDAIPIAIALEDFYHGQIWTRELLGLRPKSLVANQALKWFRETGYHLHFPPTESFNKTELIDWENVRF